MYPQCHVAMHMPSSLRLEQINQASPTTLSRGDKLKMEMLNLNTTSV